MTAETRTEDRIRNAALRERICFAPEAAALIRNGYRVGMSGFTGSGYPKLVPQALAEHILREHSHGGSFKISVMTGASTSSELDGALAMVDGIELRMPYNSDPTAREKINTGKMEYFDFHLGTVAQYVKSGFFGDIDVAIVEVTGITEDGRLIPSTSVGNNQAFIDCAREVILEVNHYQPMELEGMHDVFEPPSSLQPEIISRIKIMGGMNIAEQRLAQDGRATVEVGDRLVDLRISTLPTSFGERAVLRLLDKSIRLFDLARLGMAPAVHDGFRRLIHNDHGIADSIECAADLLLTIPHRPLRLLALCDVAGDGYDIDRLAVFVMYHADVELAVELSSVFCNKCIFRGVSALTCLYHFCYMLRCDIAVFRRNKF